MTVPATQTRIRPPQPGAPNRIASLRSGWAFDRRFFGLAAVPAFLAVFIITAVPLVIGLGLSFSSVTSTHNGVFPLTLKNYSHIWDDSEVHTVLLNTLIYVVLAVGLETLLGLGLALLMTRKNRAISVFRVIFLLPLTVAGVAAAVSWGALLNTSQGWIDYFLKLAHLPQPNWLASSTTAMPSVVVVCLWSGGAGAAVRVAAPP